MMEQLCELWDTLEKDLRKTNERIKIAGGKINGTELEYVDRLTHAMKSIKSVIMIMEAEDREGRRRTKADAEFAKKLRDVLEDAPDEATRQELQRLADKMER